MKSWASREAEDELKTGNLSSQWEDAIIDALNSGNLTVLTGSAVSMFGPTYLPTGSQAAFGMKQMLTEEYIHNAALGDKKLQAQLKKNIWRLISDLPFESTMGLLTDAVSPIEAERLIHILINTSTFNLVHEILAAWMASAPAVKGPSLAIITTNYDLGVENAISETRPSLFYRRIVSESDAQNPLGSESVLFKIHGSDAPAPPYHFVMTHDQESALPRWQTRLLHQLVDDRVLFVVGYSGLDMDILPALSQCNWGSFRSVRPLEGLSTKSPSRFIWPLFSVDPDKETLGTGVNLQDVFERLAKISPGKPMRSSPGSHVLASSRISSALESLSSEQRMLWLAHMLIHSGGWALGNQVLDAVGGHDSPSKLSARADISFYSGKYLDCARQWQAMLDNPSFNLTLAQKVKACCSAADSLNCAGDSFGAWLLLLRSIGFLLQMVISGERDALISSVGQILQRAVVAVPFLSYIPKLELIDNLVSELIRRMGALPRASVIRRFTKQTGGTLALGYRATLVNEYRYAGFSALNRFEAGDRLAERDAMNWLFKSIVWANRLDDYPGLAKAYLGLWRLYLLAADPRKALACWRCGWQYVKKVDYIGWRGFFARRFASKAEKAAHIVPESTEWAGSTNERSFKLGKFAGTLLSVR